MSVTGLPDLVNISLTTEIPGNSTGPVTDNSISRGLGILLIPLSLISFFCILSGVLYYMMKKRRLDQLRHHLVPMYSFDPGEGDDWEAEVAEPTVDLKQQTKLHDYHTMKTGSTNSPRL